MGSSAERAATAAARREASSVARAPASSSARRALDVMTRLSAPSLRWNAIRSSNRALIASSSSSSARGGSWEAREARSASVATSASWSPVSGSRSSRSSAIASRCESESGGGPAASAHVPSLDGDDGTDSIAKVGSSRRVASRARSCRSRLPPRAKQFKKRARRGRSATLASRAQLSRLATRGLGPQSAPHSPP